MELLEIKTKLKRLSETDGWRRLLGVLEEGGRGSFVMLRIVRDGKKPVLAGDIAKRTNVSTARVASALNALEKKGYVFRSKDSADGRRVVVELTESGSVALSRRETRIAEAVREITDRLSPSEIQTFFGLIEKALI